LFNLGNLFLFMAMDAPGGQTATGGQAGGGFEQLYGMLMLIVPMGLFFYFFMIRPESKRRKEREQVLNSVKVKDKVVTIGGLHGTVVDVEPTEIVILVDPKKDVKLRFRRSAVDSVESSERGEKK
jgi:preprotein translocase subunit YajC